jgi:hypothetical protein
LSESRITQTLQGRQAKKDSSGLNCKPKAPPTRKNAIDGILGIDKAVVDTDGSGIRTLRLLESNASILPPNLE